MGKSPSKHPGIEPERIAGEVEVHKDSGLQTPLLHILFLVLCCGADLSVVSGPILRRMKQCFHTQTIVALLQSIVAVPKKDGVRTREHEEGGMFGADDCGRLQRDLLQIQPIPIQIMPCQKNWKSSSFAFLRFLFIR